MSRTSDRRMLGLTSTTWAIIAAFVVGMLLSALAVSFAMQQRDDARAEKDRVAGQSQQLVDCVRDPGADDCEEKADEVAETIDNPKAGDPGEDGRDGADGRDGVDGTDGRDGKPGPRGPAGRPGRNGADGVGARGADGADGADGVNGVGVDGQDGGPGPQGPQGERGPAGPAGPAGPSGAAGTATPGTYMCADGDYLAGFAVTADGTVTTDCRPLPNPIIGDPS